MAQCPFLRAGLDCNLLSFGGQVGKDQLLWLHAPTYSNADTALAENFGAAHYIVTLHFVTRQVQVKRQGKRGGKNTGNNIYDILRAFEAQGEIESMLVTVPSLSVLHFKISAFQDELGIKGYLEIPLFLWSRKF